MTLLKEKYRDYFRIGAAVSAFSVDRYRDLLLTHFNSITCENEMKFSSVCDNNGEYHFEGADKIRDFARNNGIALRGHTLVWHNQIPAWIFEGADKAALIARMKAHIQKMGARYGNDAYCWDVVNEAIEDKAGVMMRKSGWSDIIGEDFMDYAFRYAKDAVPAATLYYNDYNETNPEKRAKICAKLREMLQRGVPVEGMGMQAHDRIYGFSTDELRRSIEAYATLGLRVQITEMDISLFRFDDKTKLEAPPVDLLKQQAAVYKECFRVFREYKDVIDAVTLWGVADDTSWLNNFPVRDRKSWPLLFDENHEPKDAFWEIVDF
jgi:endo-1,4-beta-xylanase